MLDLETLGVGSFSVIASIGAVEFNPNGGSISREHYTRINIQSCLNKGLKIDGDTVVWWMDQSDEARKSTFAGERNSLMAALTAFGNFINYDRGCKIWGNGSDFDNVILANAFKACDIECPWRWSNNRCFRTLKNLVLEKEIILPERQGTHHNALDDAIYQAKYLQAITNSLKIRVS